MTFRSIRSETFPFAISERQTDPTRALIVYIEGDGLAWVTKSRASSDPTPIAPIALKLAVIDRSPNVIWIGRPCQYATAVDRSDCSVKQWTSSRFSEAQVSALDAALNILKSSQDQKIHLIGYSGGGAIATLLAARRSDVLTLRTVAGNLDHVAFTRHHNVSALVGSLNPVDFARGLHDLPQIHYRGGDDAVVTVSVVERFRNILSGGRCAYFVEASGVGHQDGWEDFWSTNWDEIPRCTFSRTE